MSEAGTTPGTVSTDLGRAYPAVCQKLWPTVSVERFEPVSHSGAAVGWTKQDHRTKGDVPEGGETAMVEVD